MEKKRGGKNNRAGHPVRRLSHPKLRQRAMGPRDRFSDVVMVVLGVDQDSSFAALRRYLKSWKKY